MIRKTLLLVALTLALSMSPVLSTDMEDCVNKLMPMFQGNCISDYAVVATTAVELGWCLNDKEKYKDIKLSAQNLICSCKDCHTIKGNGCMGGDVKKALDYIKDGSAVGGSYIEFSAQGARTIADGGPKNYNDCMVYWTKICDPTSEAGCDIAKFDSSSTVSCPVDTTMCSRDSTKAVKDCKVTDVLRNAAEKKNSYSAIKDSINNNRPVVGTMELFEDMDFYFGTDNIYYHSSGQSLGVVSVIITAHGVDSTTNTNYWTVLVPWDKKYDSGLKINS